MEDKPVKFPQCFHPWLKVCLSLQNLQFHDQCGQNANKDGNFHVSAALICSQNHRLVNLRIYLPLRHVILGMQWTELKTSDEVLSRTEQSLVIQKSKVFSRQADWR